MPVLCCPLWIGPPYKGPLFYFLRAAHGQEFLLSQAPEQDSDIVDPQAERTWLWVRVEIADRK